jgi:tRNA(fMet)-specific endonuclease VapC
MKRVLDTDTTIAAIRNHPTVVRARLNEIGPHNVFISTITVAELWYGAENSRNPAQERVALESFLVPYELLTFDRSSAERYGVIRHQLRRAPIGDRYLLIAAIAVANGARVVTHNTREFERVPGLEVEDWTK